MITGIFLGRRHVVVGLELEGVAGVSVKVALQLT